MCELATVDDYIYKLYLGLKALDYSVTMALICMSQHYGSLRTALQAYLKVFLLVFPIFLTMFPTFPTMFLTFLTNSHPFWIQHT
jgi:hypothetical protein